jgi:hypothetical protein
LSLKIFNLRISKRIKYNKILFSMRLRACWQDNNIWQVILIFEYSYVADIKEQSILWPPLQHWCWPTSLTSSSTLLPLDKGWVLDVLVVQQGLRFLTYWASSAGSGPWQYSWNRVTLSWD